MSSGSGQDSPNGPALLADDAGIRWGAVTIYGSSSAACRLEPSFIWSDMGISILEDADQENNSRHDHWRENR
jgi:hypothetical protein